MPLHPKHEQDVADFLEHWLFCKTCASTQGSYSLHKVLCPEGKRLYKQAHEKTADVDNDSSYA